MSDKSEVLSKQQKIGADKDARLRILREKQNEDRQRKLEEIKAQAFAAQQFKEQKEQERKQRLEEMRIKEEIRRQQVEERKRAINEAERDRLESILRRNQQRENRLELKKRNERSSLVFAFGSSTPRNLDPHDLTSSYWGQRRATSTQNINTTAYSTFTRRGTERDLENGSKKRAISAGGLDRSESSSGTTTAAGCASGYLGRRRTDLMPTILPSRESLGSSRKSLTHSPASSRPSSSMSQQSTTSVISSASVVRHRPSSGGPRKPRPASIAITGVSTTNQDKRYHQQESTTKPPLPKRRTSSQNKTSRGGEITPKILISPTIDETNGDSNKKPPDVERQQCETKEVVTENLLNLDSEVVLNNDHTAITATKMREAEVETSNLLEHVHKAHEEVEGIKKEIPVNNINEKLPHVDDTKVTEGTRNDALESSDKTSIIAKEEKNGIEEAEISSADIKNENEQNSYKEMTSSLLIMNNGEMTASQIKSKISTEEEAKAAIAERRRLAKEEAARKVEQERLRIEAEQRAELERQRHEEEQVRLLIEAQRAAEEQRLNEAILEARKKEEEEQQRKDEEVRLKALKEEADRKAKIEAEKQKAEQQERFIKEEKEREERRKRVEAIMLRTRGKQNANSQNSEDEQKSENKINGTKPADEQNGPNKLVKDEIVDNIISEDQMKNANSVSIETINNSSGSTTTSGITADSINSNNLWQTATQQYGNIVLNNNS